MEGFLCLIYYTTPLTQRVQTEGPRQVPLLPLSPHQSRAEVETQAEVMAFSLPQDGQMEEKRIPIFVVPTRWQQGKKEAGTISIC